MINKDYLNEFHSPIRKISGKAELYASSAATAQGNPIVIEKANGDIDIQLTSKNLINLEGREVVNFGGFDKAERRKYQGGKGIILGLAANNYYAGDKNPVYSVGNNQMSYVLAQPNYGFGVDVKLKPNTKYALSCTASSGYGITLLQYDVDGNFLGTASTSNSILTTNPNADWGLIYITYSQAGTTVSLTEPQLEFGEIKTPYTPYIEDFSAIPVDNNLVASGFSESNPWYIASEPFYLEQGKTYKYEITTVDGTSLSPVITSSGWGGDSSPALAFGGNVLEFTMEYPTGDWVLYLDTTVDNIASASLIEVGADTTKPATITASPYEEYIEPVEYEVDSEGKLTIPAITPNTIISTGDYGIINATYSTMTLNNTFLASDQLSSITIDRDGESGKFFGYGISQKATIKLVDKNREISLAKDNLIKIYFNINDNDYVNNFPTFITETPTRNENTNEITIVANDKLTAAAAHTVEELGLKSYTIREFASAIASLLGLKLVIRGLEDDSCFDTQYDNGANFSGKETLRQALNAVAEATQTIYFISGDNLTFRKLDIGAAADLAITKNDYFTLENKDKYTIDSVGSITELGDNITSHSTGGQTQNVKNNPFWELREDIAELVENAAAAINGLSINAFNCKWRGNFLVELGDKIEITTKDNDTIIVYLLNDSISYSGGFKQVSKWEYTATETPSTNPTTLGEAIRQTSAKVDKVNKQISLVVSETEAHSAAIAQLELRTDSINASVAEKVDNLEKEVAAKVSASDISIQIKNELDNGVSKVITSTGFILDEKGFTVEKSDGLTKTTITENGMSVNKSDTDEAVLVANNEGVDAVNLKASTYLIVGKNSRFEDYGDNRTGCFWIGG